MQVNFTTLRVDKMEFFNELPQGNSQLQIDLEANILTPNDLEKKSFLIQFALKIHDGDNKKFCLSLIAKTQGTYEETFDSFEELKKEIDSTIPDVIPELQTLIKNITTDFGMRPMDIPLEVY